MFILYNVSTTSQVFANLLSDGTIFADKQPMFVMLTFLTETHIRLKCKTTYNGNETRIPGEFPTAE